MCASSINIYGHCRRLCGNPIHPLCHLGRVHEQTVRLDFLLPATSLTIHLADSAYDLLSPKPHSFCAIFTSSCFPPRICHSLSMLSSTVAGRATKTNPRLVAPNSSAYRPHVPTTQVFATGKKPWVASCSSVSLRGCPRSASQS